MKYEEQRAILLLVMTVIFCVAPKQNQVLASYLPPGLIYHPTPPPPGLIYTTPQATPAFPQALSTFSRPCLECGYNFSSLEVSREFSSWIGHD